MTHKACTGCKEVWPDTMFRVEPNTGGLRSRCIICQRVYAAAYYQKNKKRLDAMAKKRLDAMAKKRRK